MSLNSSLLSIFYFMMINLWPLFAIIWIHPHEKADYKCTPVILLRIKPLWAEKEGRFAVTAGGLSNRNPRDSPKARCTWKGCGTVLLQEWGTHLVCAELFCKWQRFAFLYSLVGSFPRAVLNNGRPVSNRESLRHLTSLMLGEWEWIHMIFTLTKKIFTSLRSWNDPLHCSSTLRNLEQLEDTSSISRIGKAISSKRMMSSWVNVWVFL